MPTLCQSVGASNWCGQPGADTGNLEGGGGGGGGGGARHE